MIRLVGALLFCLCATVSNAEPYYATPFSFGSPSLIAIARQDIGKTGPQLGLPARLWCGAFLGRVARKAGFKAPANPNLARNWAAAGRRLHGPQVGAIAVFPRGRGGHVGIVTSVGNGTITVISGNHNRRVAESAYPTRRAIAFVWPGA